jgi:uncharacterized glyoxalase superfamily protein PhnB
VPVLSQVNLVVGDLDRTLTFYRRLGWEFRTTGGQHAETDLPGGFRVEFDTARAAGMWDSGATGPAAGSTVLGLALETRAAVDALYGELVAHGSGARQPPYDAFWGARYAIVVDPDGHPLGLMSPIDDAERYWPPREPPRP